MAQLNGKKIANNDLNMIARTIKNQLLLVSCSCFNEKPNSEFLRIISTIHIVSTSKNKQKSSNWVKNFVKNSAFVFRENMW